ncbi:hypothetical protein N0V86_000658 [Didymella sp. IMI 355093]|nr:hypothetical protein N0V86_000658 [Didymella sp. IMI 355093]
MRLTMAPQHRRGGKHAVKDEDLTHTKYDEYNREQLLAAVKEAGCYVKDDKKSVMARKLAEHDQNKQYEERRAARERKEKEEVKQQKLANTAQAQKDRQEARASRNEEREMRRELGEDVSSNSDDTDDDRGRCDAHELTITGGEALSEATWEDTSSETTVRSQNPPVRPACRLQLLEWPYPNSPPSSLSSDPEPEHYPALLAYAPLKLATTITHEKLTLPGKTYPVGVDPDYVPTLDTLTRSATRHGHLLNQLSHAIIEPASLWRARTTVQGWNGRMYFALAPQSLHDKKDARLDDVYRKWHTAHAKLLQPTPGVTDVKADRQARFKQIATEKRRRVAEVYEASSWKPRALVYMPAYLDWETGTSDEDVGRDRTVENLWYVRFPGCDVPHYYFWSREGEWSDPTVPDPSWSAEAFKPRTRVETEAEPCSPPRNTWFRVKKLTSLPTYNAASAKCFNTLKTTHENDLLAHGLSFTLAKNRRLAISAGRQQAWHEFTAQIPRLYPSSIFPRAPPAQAEEDMCLADKISALLSGCDVQPYSSQEAWTRNDDTFWDVVSAAELSPVLDLAVTSATNSLHSRPYAEHAHAHNAPSALHRRDSFDVLPPSAEDRRIWTWLESISASFPALTTPLSAEPISLDDPISPLDLNARSTTPTCPFCSLDWTLLPDWEKAAHMLAHNHISTQPVTLTSREDAVGKGVKRRYSLLSHRTLLSYHKRFGGRKMMRGDSARSLAGSLAQSVRDDVVQPIAVAYMKAARETSPFSKERRRLRAMRDLQVGSQQGRGGRGWMLERAQSDVESGSESQNDELIDGEMDEEWRADDERAAEVDYSITQRE